MPKLKLAYGPRPLFRVGFIWKLRNHTKTLGFLQISLKTQPKGVVRPKPDKPRLRQDALSPHPHAPNGHQRVYARRAVPAAAPISATCHQTGGKCRASASHASSPGPSPSHLASKCMERECCLPPATTRCFNSSTCIQAAKPWARQEARKGQQAPKGSACS